MDLAGPGRAELYGTDATIARLLDEAQVWAVVGLSSNTRRPAYGVARFLQEHGKRIVPVHPRADVVHGERGYPSLDAIPLDVDIDVVDVFVRSELAGRIAEEAIEVAAARDCEPAVWFQLGVVDEEAAARVVRAGGSMVMDRCPAIDWPMLGPPA